MISATHNMEFTCIESKIKSLTLDSENQLMTSTQDCYSLLTTNTDNPESLQKLQQGRLRYVLEQLQKEREDASFSRNCLFCKKYFVGNRSLLLNHLMEQHNFVIGAPDNIVFINELLDILENMLKNLQCFFCEKTFKDWMTLKEHMRKKQHKQINPKNKSFDKFYLINYLELGKTWVDVQNEEDGFSQDSDETEMDTMEWLDESSVYVCLFCNYKLFDFEKLLIHMKDDHKFDFNELKKRHNLSFYSQIKFINFIRRKIFEKECTVCDQKFAFQNELIHHMMESGHISILPEQDKWDQTMFYFSTFENDNLLCALDVEDSECEEEKYVYPEDPVLPKFTVLSDENIRKSLL